MEGAYVRSGKTLPPGQVQTYSNISASQQHEHDVKAERKIDCPRWKRQKKNKRTAGNGGMFAWDDQTEYVLNSETVIF